MCGIAGVVSSSRFDPEVARAMGAALSHRGPDGEGLFADECAALAHRRLSIIDVEGGAQPQFNEDQSVAVVFNGEIYNYRELMRELSGRHRFRTESDTEVLVHLYEERGESLVDELRGMFSFAIWDRRKRVLIAARDRFGEKPFYYTQTGGVFLFASELGALLASGLCPQEIDRAALSSYLEFLYIPAPRTIFAGVKKLPAGHLLRLDQHGLNVRRYWDPPVPGSAPSRAADPAALRRILEESTRLRLRSDVPLGAMLSGGVDSSVVVGLMAEALGPGVRTFAVGFGRSDDELPFARAVSEAHRTEHHEIQVDANTAENTIAALSAYTEPFGDSSAVPTFAIAREISKHVKVVLTGDGGDELFAGYGRYNTVRRIPRLPFAKRVASALERIENLPRRSALRRAFAAAGSGPTQRHRYVTEVFSASERARLLGGGFGVFRFDGHARHPTDAAIEFDLNVYLPDDLMTKVDIAAMKFGLEARAPLLDHHLAQYAVPFAPRQKIDGVNTKLLLREACKDLLPEAVKNRPKRGFGSPVEMWLTGPLRSLVIDSLLSSNSWIRGHLDQVEVARVARMVTAGTGNAHQLWALLALEVWARATKWP